MKNFNLALFPLHLVAFPDEEVNLHIFEPRYRQLIRDCEEENITFGITPYEDGMTMRVATEMRLIEVSHRYPDGKMDVKTKALGLVEIKDFSVRMEAKLYPGGEVTRLVRPESRGDAVLVAEVYKMIDELYKFMQVDMPVSEWRPESSIYQFGHKIGLTFKQEMELLLLSNENDRLLFVKNHLSQVIPTVRRLEDMKTKVQMNGHFKNITPPELGL